MRIACLLLAAGAATRFGGCKQLAEIDGKTLIRHALDKLQPLFPGQIYTVLGAYRELIQPVISDSCLTIIHAQWQQGLGSSIASGVKAIDELAEYDGILIALPDQFLLSREDYRRLIDSFDGGQIVAAYYAGKPAVPAIFPGRFYPQLKQLAGDRGARSMLRQMADELISIPLAAAAVDIDSQQDLEQLGQGRNRAETPTS